MIRDNVAPNDAKRFLLQINRLWDKLRLIFIIEPFDATFFVPALGAMIMADFDEQVVFNLLFLR